MSATINPDLVELVRSELSLSHATVRRLQAALDALVDQQPSTVIEEEPPATVPAAPARPTPPAKAETKPKRPAPRDALTHEEWVEHARVANAAIDAGRSASKAIAEHFGIKPDAARMRIRRARELGHKIAFTRPDRAAVPAPSGSKFVTVDEAAALIEQLDPDGGDDA